MTLHAYLTRVMQEIKYKTSLLTTLNILPSIVHKVLNDIKELVYIKNIKYDKMVYIIKDLG